MSDLYETDFAAWSAEQARAIRDAGRRGVNEPIDWENVAEEIENLGRSERRELVNRIGTVIEHLLKLEVSPAAEPERSWRETVLRTRRAIARILDESPSLRREVPNIIAAELAAQRELVLAVMAEYGETPRRPPESITYDEAKVLGNWLPERWEQSS
jgi:hypothetical protein